MDRKESDRIKGKAVNLVQLDSSGRRAVLQPPPSHLVSIRSPNSRLNTTVPESSQALRSESDSGRSNISLPSRRLSSSFPALNQNLREVTEGSSEGASLGLGFGTLVKEEPAKTSISYLPGTQGRPLARHIEKRDSIRGEVGSHCQGSNPVSTQTGPLIAQVSTRGISVASNDSDSDEIESNQEENSENLEELDSSSENLEGLEEKLEQLDQEEDQIDQVEDEHIDQEGEKEDQVEKEEEEEEMSSLGGITFPNQISAPTLPQFDPDSDSVSEFLDNFTMIASSIGWKPEQKVNMLPLCLNPIARQWYMHYKENNVGVQ